jgi:hypothetical protein
MDSAHAQGQRDANTASEAVATRTNVASASARSESQASLPRDFVVRIASTLGRLAAADAEERSRPRRAPQAVADRREIVEGGCLSNTHPQTSHETLAGYPEYTVSGGFDWLAWSAGVDWIPICFGGIFLELEWVKKSCQDEKKPFEWLDLIGVGPVRVFRTGLNHGGDKGQHFEFKLSYRGVVIGLAKKQFAAGNRPNLFVVQTGRDCLLIGAQESYRIVREFIELLGGIIKFERVSRADLCLDIAGLDVAILQEAVERRQFVSVARSVRPHHELVREKKSGFEAGKHPLHLTVYDKSHEMRDKCDALYLEAMIERRWGGAVPPTATRIEFQASRPWLVKNGINSPLYLFRLAGSLVEKLTGNWFRLTDAPVDRENNNQSRAATLPLWASIQHGFAKVFGRPLGPLSPLHRERVSPARLVRQGRGCLVNALLQRGTKCVSYDDLVVETAKLMHDIEPTPAEKRKFINDFHRRETEFLA